MEYCDLACPYCADIQPALKELLNAYPGELSLVFRYFPITQHTSSLPAAEAAECAARQGAFWKYQDLLFASRQEWISARQRQAAFLGYARRLGLEPQAFASCLARGESSAAVKKDYEDAKRKRLAWTPTLLINGRRILWDSSPAKLAERVRRELAKAAQL